MVLWILLSGCAAVAEPDAPVAPAARATAGAAALPRGLWVLCEGSQRVLERREHLAALFADAEALGVSDLFVQVYRGGRAWYDASRADPDPYLNTWRDGERDALQVLIDEAHARGLRVHAWVNVLSLSANAQAPILGRLGRQAVLVDSKGRSILDFPEYEVPEPDRRWYRMGTPAIWLDPAAPGVADELVATFAELVERYPGLDGLHLDYVRYADVLPFSPGTRFGVGLSFGFGQASRARFHTETGLTAPFGASLHNGNAFDDWRREKLRELVARIAGEAKARRPGLRVSAAVIADRERGYLVDFQDWAGWLDAGLLDFAVPMLYTRDPTLLRHGVESLAGLARSRELWVGLGTWLFTSEPEEALWQIETVAGEPGLGSALFSWDSIRAEPAFRDALVRALAGAAPPAPAALDAHAPSSRARPR